MTRNDPADFPWGEAWSLLSLCCCTELVERCVHNSQVWKPTPG